MFVTTFKGIGANVVRPMTDVYISYVGSYIMALCFEGRCGLAYKYCGLGQGLPSSAPSVGPPNSHDINSLHRLPLLAQAMGGALTPVSLFPTLPPFMVLPVLAGGVGCCGFQQHRLGCPFGPCHLFGLPTSTTVEE